MIHLNQDDVWGEGDCPMKSVTKIGPLTVRRHVRSGIKTGKWQLDIPATFNPKGQRKRKIFENRKEAEDTARRLKRYVESRPIGQTQSTTRSIVTFSQVAKEWLDLEQLGVLNGGKAESTHETDSHRIKPLVRFFGSLEVVKIEELHIQQYKAQRLFGPKVLLSKLTSFFKKAKNGDINFIKRPRTVNAETALLNRILNYAVKKGWIVHVPTTRKIEDVPIVYDIPDLKQMKALLESVDQSTLPIIWFLCETGCRPDEAYNLIWDAVKEDRGYVKIVGREDWKPKNEESVRDIPIGGELLDLFRIMRENCRGRYVFPSPRNTDQHRTNIRHALKAGVRKANLRREDGSLMHITPKVFRKAVATLVADSGTPEIALQKLLGHVPGSPITSKYYIKAVDETVVRAAKIVRLSPIVTFESEDKDDSSRLVKIGAWSNK